MVHMQENGFFEYLELQGNDELVLKSELQAEVRRAGLSLSVRNLTFYISEGLVPQSVRAGSRAGVYPKIVVELMIWILSMRKAGASIDTLRELLPIWKFLIRSRLSHRLDIGELEYVARQFATSTASQFAVPAVVAQVMLDVCCQNPHPDDDIIVVDKVGVERKMTAAETTIGFSIARPLEPDDDDLDDDDEGPARQWIASRRITLSPAWSPNSDPTAVMMGRRNDEPMPPDDEPRRLRPEADNATQEVQPQVNR
jgi:DNA-binding transcriptional MerR regulator